MLVTCVVHFLAELREDDVGLLLGFRAEEQSLHVDQLFREVLLGLTKDKRKGHI